MSDSVPSTYSASLPAEPADSELDAFSGGALSNTIRRFVEAIRDNFTVRTVYGDPVEAHGVTVIPVAQTYFGFGVGGGGGGARRAEEGRTKADTGGGAGAGGGGVVRPLGFIEITAAGARWVPYTLPWQRVARMAAPAILGVVAARMARRRLTGGK